MATPTSFDVIGMQEIANELLQGISGGAYFWDDFAGGSGGTGGTGGTDDTGGTTTSTTTNLIPTPR